jgi:hypothetical protein
MNRITRERRMRWKWENMREIRRHTYGRENKGDRKKRNKRSALRAVKASS